MSSLMGIIRVMASGSSNTGNRGLMLFLTVVGEGVVERSVTPAELNKKDMVLTW